MKSVLKNYIALIVVIILWVAVWALADTLGEKYLKTHDNKIKFYSLVAVFSSIILVVFFPGDMWF